MSAVPINGATVSVGRFGWTELGGVPVMDYARAVMELTVRASDPDDDLHDRFDAFRVALAHRDELGPAVRDEDDERTAAADAVDDAFGALVAELSEPLTLDPRTAAGTARTILALLAAPVPRAA